MSICLFKLSELAGQYYAAPGWFLLTVYRFFERRQTKGKRGTGPDPLDWDRDMRYFRITDEGYHATGVNWGGNPTYWLEVNDRGDAERELQVYPNGNMLRYDREHEEDEYGALSVMVLDADEEFWAPSEITRDEFEAGWRAHPPFSSTRFFLDMTFLQGGQANRVVQPQEVRMELLHLNEHPTDQFPGSGPVFRVLPDGQREEASVFPLAAEVTFLGRAERAGVHVVLPDFRANRTHAAIRRRSDGYYIEDLHSRNGTMVNADRLASDARKLEEGDRITILGYVFEFRS